VDQDEPQNTLDQGNQALSVLPLTEIIVSESSMLVI
jgi:hypothetical protein